jgi:tRNA pseudouridine55 synthase
MNGLVNVIKPPEMTSFDMVAYLRGIFKTRKVGHAGTLDPGAAGVLPICIGSATKAVQYMSEWNKFYRAEALLGIKTDTGDSEGTVISTQEVNVSDEQIKTAVSSFKGEYMQLPPMYSAVKTGGKKLYEYARKGIEVERKRRRVEIYGINTVTINRSDGIRVLFDVECSKGTYIRVLCEDIGDKLGCGAHMSFLLRKRTGPFDISTALTLEEIGFLAENEKLDEAITDTGFVFKNLKRISLDESRCRRIRNGTAVKVDISCSPTGSLISMYNENNCFFGLGTLVKNDSVCYLKPKKLFL